MVLSLVLILRGLRVAYASQVRRVRPAWQGGCYLQLLPYTLFTPDPRPTSRSRKGSVGVGVGAHVVSVPGAPSMQVQGLVDTTPLLLSSSMLDLH